jgi:hypothetical protein
LATSPYFTLPSISVMTAGSLGRRALEQLDHPGETARDVLGLGGLARDLGQDVSRRDLGAVLHHQVRARGQQVLLLGLALLVLDLDARLLLLVGRLHDDLGRHAGVLVHLLVHGLAVQAVAEGGLAALLGEDGEGVRIPLDQQLALLHFLAVLHLPPGRPSCS